MYIVIWIQSIINVLNTANYLATALKQSIQINLSDLPAVYTFRKGGPLMKDGVSTSLNQNNCL